jgi:hypothetical protein
MKEAPRFHVSTANYSGVIAGLGRSKNGVASACLRATDPSSSSKQPA